MAQYLVAIYLPDDYDPSVETEATIEEIRAPNREIAAGARKFACGLSPASSARSLRAQPDGTVLVTDGPYLETKEDIGGFSVAEAADLDEALAWGAQGCRRMPCAGQGAPDFFQAGPEGNNGIVWPPRLPNMRRLDQGMNEPARSYAAGSYPEGRGEEQ